MNESARAAALQQAEYFLHHETQFHLGCLPTEQPHPATVGLDEVCRRDTAAGVAMLRKVDRDILPRAAAVFAAPEYQHLTAVLEQTLRRGGRIGFSGCGATGRLSILLEAAWRKACRSGRYPEAQQYEDRVFSIMTGGDYALVRSVEFFEDYESFGRRQARDRQIGPQDALIAITEGGETSSVLGSALEAADAGAAVFLAFNNPADILCEKIERSRRAIRDPRLTVLDLHTGPMAIAGSTRMQAVTTELLVIGQALETVFARIAGLSGNALPEPVAVFATLLDELDAEANRRTLAAAIEFEEDVYRRRGLVTYFADQTLLDIFTDTTERAPTFMLPPFVKSDDPVSPQSWAFVKNPLRSTAQAWDAVYARPPRCLEWTLADYRAMGADERLLAAPPRIGADELAKFPIGKEKAVARLRQTTPSVAVAVLADSDVDAAFLPSFARRAADFSDHRILHIGRETADAWNIVCRVPATPLGLWERLAVKLVMNTLSTLTMTRLGRVQSNWMAWVETSNKKLIDRGARLIAELCGLSYENACRELFISNAEIAAADWTGKAKPSPVQYTVNRLRQ